MMILDQYSGAEIGIGVDTERPSTSSQNAGKEKRMEPKLFVHIVRRAQSEGLSEIRGELTDKFGGVRKISIRVGGLINGNPHDLQATSRSGFTHLGRIYLGSKNIEQNLGGWPERIEFLFVENFGAVGCRDPRRAKEIRGALSY